MSDNPQTNYITEKELLISNNKMLVPYFPLSELKFKTLLEKGTYSSVFSEKCLTVAIGFGIQFILQAVFVGIENVVNHENIQIDLYPFLYAVVTFLLYIGFRCFFHKQNSDRQQTIESITSYFKEKRNE